jgi:VanZ family protein
MRVRFLLLWILAVVTVTLAPFHFGSDVTDGGFLTFRAESGQHAPLHLLLNVMLFAPLGALVHHSRRRSRSLVSMMIAAGVLAVFVSGTIEFLQRFLPGRESSMVDAAANILGAPLGVALDRLWGPAAATQFDRLHTAVSAPQLLGLLTAVTAIALVISAALQTRTRLSNWNVNYPLLIGNERTGDRPWRGRVFSVAITDAATPESVVRRFADGEPAHLSGRVVAVFDMSDAPPYRDMTGTVPPLEQQGAWDWPWLRSSGPATSLVQKLQETNAFTLRVVCESDDVNQSGPARILSNSQSPLSRNFTVAQNHDALVVRLRTPSTGVNGIRPELLVPDVFSRPGTRDILVTYDGATLVAAAADHGRVSRMAMGPGFVLAESMVSPELPIGSGLLPMWEIAYLAFLFVLPGALFAVGQRVPNQFVIGCLWLALFAMLLEVTLMLSSGRSFDWRRVALTFSVGAVVVPGMSVLARGRSRR